MRSEFTLVNHLLLVATHALLVSFLCNSACSPCVCVLCMLALQKFVNTISCGNFTRFTA